jgi:hypothetical protein
MRIPCPTCHRLGTVDKAYPAGTAMGYVGPNGECWPQETCQTCMGSGWVNDEKPVKTDAEKAIEITIGASS